MGIVCLFLTSCGLPKTSAPNDYIGLSEGQKIHTTEKLKKFKTDRDAPFQRPEGPIQVTVEDAILLALENNLSLMVERLNPPIRRTFEAEERAVFDPFLTGELAYSREKSQQEGSLSPASPDTTSSITEFDLGASQFFPTGTTASVDLFVKVILW